MIPPSTATPILLEFYIAFSREQEDTLWKQEVNMDDWDYAIFVPNGSIDLVDKYGEEKRHSMDMLLNGCCDNRWYDNIMLDGRHGILGVAYHA